MRSPLCGPALPVLVLVLHCLCGGAAGRTITVGMLLDFNGISGANWTEDVQQKAAALGAAQGVTVDLRLYHVNDTNSAAQGAQQMLVDKVAVVVGTDDAATANVVRYAFADHPNATLLISFCEGSEHLAGQRDHFFVSAYAQESRAWANLRLAQVETYNHIILITDKVRYACVAHATVGAHLRCSKRSHDARILWPSQSGHAGDAVWCSSKRQGMYSTRRLVSGCLSCC